MHASHQSVDTSHHRNGNTTRSDRPPKIGTIFSILPAAINASLGKRLSKKYGSLGRRSPQKHSERQLSQVTLVEVHDGVNRRSEAAAWLH